MSTRVVRRIASRVGASILTVFVVCTLVFLLLRLIPGDPVLQILGNEATPRAIAELRDELHLNGPLWQQYLDYLGDLVRGNLGTSLAQQGVSVTSIIAAAVPSTITIAVLGLIVGVLCGMVGGVGAAVSRHRIVDSVVQTLSILAMATPTFLFALLLVLIFALDLKLLPAGGWPGTFPANLAYAVLPAIALGVNLAPRFLRPVRQEAIDVQSTLFMEAAISRGLSRSSLNRRHVLPNSLLPLVTLVGMSLGGLLTNAVIVEAVFGIPGLGTQLAQAVAQRDYPVIQGITLVMSVTVIAGNLLAEIAYQFVDPRARVE